MSITTLDYASPFFPVSYVQGEDEYAVREKSIVFNMSDEDLYINGRPLGFFRRHGEGGRVGEAHPPNRQAPPEIHHDLLVLAAQRDGLGAGRAAPPAREQGDTQAPHAPSTIEAPHDDPRRR